MKKRIILLSSFLLLSFFMVNNLVAQEKTQEASKAKTEMHKKAPSKCASCPSLAKCNKEAAVEAKDNKGKELEGKEEKPVATNEKKKTKKK